MQQEKYIYISIFKKRFFQLGFDNFRRMIDRGVYKEILNKKTIERIINVDAIITRRLLEIEI